MLCKNSEDLEMIRNRSPPGVCWLTVRASGGILKISIAFFLKGFIVNAAALLRWKIYGLYSSTTSPSATRKFQKNFRKISPLFHRPCNRFLDEKMRYRGGIFLPWKFLKKQKNFCIFMHIFCLSFPSNHPVNRSNLFRKGLPSLPDTLPAQLAYVC